MQIPEDEMIEYKINLKELVISFYMPEIFESDTAMYVIDRQNETMAYKKRMTSRLVLQHVVALK